MRELPPYPESLSEAKGLDTRGVVLDDANVYFFANDLNAFIRVRLNEDRDLECTAPVRRRWAGELIEPATDSKKEYLVGLRWSGMVLGAGEDLVLDILQ